MLKKMKRKSTKFKGKLLAASLAVSLLLSMSATAFAEVETVEDEPDWNEAGLRLQDYMDEYADDPEVLAMLEGFLERNFDDLVGEMPEAEEVEEVVTEDEAEEVAEVVPTALALPPQGIVTPMNALFTGGTIGITPMSTTGVQLSADGKTVIGYTGPGGAVTIPNGVTAIRYSAFSRAQSITSISLPNGLLTIGDSAFEYTKITTLTIPDSVTFIGEGAFGSCRELKTVVVGSKVNTIGAGAFGGCLELTSVTFRNPTPPIFEAIGSHKALSSSNAVSTVTVPRGSQYAYSYAYGPGGYHAISNAMSTNCSLHTAASCTCGYNLGCVSGGTKPVMADALAIQRYARNLYPNLIQQSQNGAVDKKAMSAALISKTARNLNRPFEVDADVILNYLVKSPNCIDKNCGSSCKICK